MLFKRISRSSAETIFVVCKNVSGSTATAGYHVVWDTGSSADGVRVTQASAGDLNAYAGIADSDIANDDFGLIQVYGYRSSARVLTSPGTSPAGVTFTVIAANWGITPDTSGNSDATAKAFGFMCAVVVSSTATSAYLTTAAVFVRAL